MTSPLQPQDADDGLDALVRRQRNAFLAEGPPPARLREDRVDRLMHIVLSNAERLVDALDADYGHRSRVQSTISDVLGPLPALKHTRRHLARWMKPQHYGAGPLGLIGARAWVEWQPLGVVGVISPWNFPIGLAFVPLAAAFAAGNRALLKASELVPATSDLMREAVQREFDAAELSVITGGPDVGAAFSRLPLDHLFFTGATPVGRHVQRAAAEHLVPVTLELGGKSPVFVHEQADFAFVARRVMAGKSINSGQLCLSPDTMWVPRARLREMAQALSAAATRLFPTLLDNDDCTSVVGARHHARLQACIEDARAKGAEVIRIDPAGEDFSRQRAHKMAPTLLLNVTDDMQAAHEELFGPLICLRGYDALDEAFDHSNRGPKPLAAYWFGPKGAARDRFVREVHSGGATLDDVILHHGVEDMPFGGVGASGMGTYHGRHGFETFSHARSMYQAPRAFSMLQLAAPPYGARFRKLLDGQVAREARAVAKRLKR